MQTARQESGFEIEPFCDLKPVQEQNQRMLEFWLGLKSPGQLPLYSRFDPLDITHHLPSIMMMNCPSKEQSQITLFGSKLVTSLGIDLTGLNFYDIYEAAERERSIERTWTIRSYPAIGLAIYAGQSAKGSPVKAEALTLPLANDDGTVERLLLSVAVFTFDGTNPNIEHKLHRNSFDDYRFFAIP